VENMPRKTQIMHVPIEIFNRHGKEKLQQLIIDFDKNYSGKENKKIIVDNPELEVKKKESGEDGDNNNDVSRSDISVSGVPHKGDPCFRNKSTESQTPTPEEAPPQFTLEQRVFLESDRFKEMMLHGIAVNFKPLYLDACIAVLKEQHNLHVDRADLIEIMKDMNKSKPK
jgi:hypothetical protein